MVFAPSPLNVFVSDDEAASSVISFVLAGVLILGALGAVVLTSDGIARDGQTGAVDAEERRSQAEGLISLLIDSPGYQSGGDPWVADDPETAKDLNADTLQRLGLLDPLTGYLSLPKFQNLRLAPFATDADQYVNYEEARAQLGMTDQHLDFHIRVYPTLVEVQDRLACIPKEVCRDPNLRVTYVGDIDGTSSSSPTWTDPECSVSEYDDNYHRVSIRISNDGGTQTQFEAHLKIDDGSGAAQEFSGVSPIAASGDKVWIHIDVPETSDVDCDDGTEFQVTLSDTSAALATEKYTAFTRTGTPTEDDDAFTAEFDRQHYVSGDTATVWYEGAAKDDTISWELLESDDPLAAIVESNSGSFSAPKNAKDQFFTFTVPSTTLSKASHRLVVTNEAEDQTHSVLLAFRQDDSVPLDDYDPGSASASSAMATEIGFLEDLVQNFCPANYDDATKTWMDADEIDASGSTTADKLANRCVDELGDPRTYAPSDPSQHGDVYWDDKDVIAPLCGRMVELESDGSCPGSNHVGTLEWTDLLIVGSHVDHNSMTKATFKWPLEAWVEAGGTVVAFGSPSTTTEWLQPIFHVGHTSSSGGISTPDSSHPLLSRPNELDYSSYDTAGEGWRFQNDDAADKFTTVVKQGDDPISSISDSGTFGEGTVMISTWLPYDPYGTGEVPADGLAMMDNFITQAYRDLFLDYGPPIPSDQEAVPAFGRAQIEHDKLGLIDLDIAVFVFPGGS